MADPNIVISPLRSNPNPYPDGERATPKTDNTLAAAGTTQANAAAVPSNVTIVTNNDTSNGVILPAAEGFDTVIYGTLNAICKVYPPVGGSINNGTVNASVSLVARKPGRFVCYDGINYIMMTDTIA